MAELPAEVDAGESVDAKSEAGSEFRECLAALWVCPVSAEITRTSGDETDPATKASMASRALTQALGPPPLRLERHFGRGWEQVHAAYHCWWRLMGTDRSPILWLAMRHLLAGQVGVSLPGVRSARSLTTLARRYTASASCSCPFR